MGVIIVSQLLPMVVILPMTQVMPQKILLE
jgi:hypothetical protein